MSDKFYGSASGLTISSDAGKAFIGAGYNSGIQHGDIKGAFMCEASEDDLVGIELVTNGTFDTDITGWTEASAGSATISWNASGYIDLNGAADGRAQADQSFTTVAGNTYVFSCEVTDTTPYQISVGTSAGGNQLVTDSDGAGDSYFTFVATTTTTHVRLRSRQVSETVSIDNISVKLANEDRSVNNNGLQSTGQSQSPPWRQAQRRWPIPGSLPQTTFPSRIILRWISGQGIST